MKKLLLSVLVSALAFINWVDGVAQCGDCLGNISATVSQTQVCEGETVQITSSGSPAAYYNDFNTSTIGVGWAINFTPMFSNPCDPSPDASPYCWMGSSTTAPRILSTIDFNVSGGGNISFDFDMATQGDPSPCEGPDLTNEGIYLDFSTDGGSSWINIFYFNPVPLGGPYVSWANYSFPIPPEAQTQCTRFRWAQTSSSANVNDHWGLDNIQIGPSGGGPYSLYWLGNPAAPTDTTTNLVVTADTTLILVLQTANDTCYDTISIDMIPAPTGNLVINNPYCVGEPVVFDASASSPSSDITSYAYDLDNNGSYETTSPTPLFNAPGSFTGTAGNKVVHMVTVTPIPGCQDTVTTTVQIFNNPTIGANVLDPTVCPYNVASFTGSAFMFNAPGQSSTVANYAWDLDFDGIPDTTGTSLTALSNFYTGLGPHTVVLTVTSSVGCQTTDTVTFSVVDIPHGNIVAPQVCGNLPASISFNNTGTPPATTFSWNFGDLSTTTDVSSLPSPQYLYPNAGFYIITLIAGTADGCLDTMSQFINIDPLPAGNITNTAVCVGVDETFNFTQTSADSITSYAWTFPGGTPGSSTLPVETVNFGSPGPINVGVIVTNQYGCKDTVVVPFMVRFLPNPTFGVYPICISRFTFDPFTANPNADLDWTMGDGTTFMDQDSSLFNYIYNGPGDYTVNLTITDEFGCVNSNDSVIHVDDSLFIQMPNVLVQTSAYQNDKIDMNELSPAFNLCINYTYTVFDRWGVKVFQTHNDPHNPDLGCGSCFRGKAQNGATLVPGVYYYVMEGNYNIIKSGSITVFE